MPESGTYGSVRGASSNGRPSRNPRPVHDLGGTLDPSCGRGSRRSQGWSPDKSSQIDQLAVLVLKAKPGYIGIELVIAQPRHWEEMVVGPPRMHPYLFYR